MPAARGPGVPMVQGVGPRGGQVLRERTHRTRPGGGSGGVPPGGAGTDHVAPGYPTAAAGGETNGGGGDAELAGDGQHGAGRRSSAEGGATGARRAQQAAAGRAGRAPAQAAVPAAPASGRTARAGGTGGGRQQRRLRGGEREPRRGPRPRRNALEEGAQGGGGAALEDPDPGPSTPSPPPPRGWEGGAARGTRAQPTGREGTPPTRSGQGARLRGRAPPPRPSAKEGGAEARRTTPGTGGRATGTPPPPATPPPPPQRAPGGAGRGARARLRGAASKPGPVRRRDRAGREGASQGGQPYPPAIDQPPLRGTRAAPGALPPPPAERSRPRAAPDGRRHHPLGRG